MITAKFEPNELILQHESLILEKPERLTGDAHMWLMIDRLEGNRRQLEVDPEVAVAPAQGRKMLHAQHAPGGGQHAHITLRRDGRCKKF